MIYAESASLNNPLDLMFDSAKRVSFCNVQRSDSLFEHIALTMTRKSLNEKQPAEVRFRFLVW